MSLNTEQISDEITSQASNSIVSGLSHELDSLSPLTTLEIASNLDNKGLGVVQKHAKAPPELQRELLSFERLYQAARDENELLEFKNYELLIKIQELEQSKQQVLSRQQFSSEPATQENSALVQSQLQDKDLQRQLSPASVNEATEKALVGYGTPTRQRPATEDLDFESSDLLASKPKLDEQEGIWIEKCAKLSNNDANAIVDNNNNKVYASHLCQDDFIPTFAVQSEQQMKRALQAACQVRDSSSHTFVLDSFGNEAAEFSKLLSGAIGRHATIDSPEPCSSLVVPPFRPATHLKSDDKDELIIMMASARATTANRPVDSRPSGESEGEKTTTTTKTNESYCASSLSGRFTEQYKSSSRIDLRRDGTTATETSRKLVTSTINHFKRNNEQSSKTDEGGKLVDNNTGRAAAAAAVVVANKQTMSKQWQEQVNSKVQLPADHHRSQPNLAITGNGTGLRQARIAMPVQQLSNSNSSMGRNKSAKTKSVTGRASLAFSKQTPATTATPTKCLAAKQNRPITSSTASKNHATISTSSQLKARSKSSLEQRSIVRQSSSSSYTSIVGAPFGRTTSLCRAQQKAISSMNIRADSQQQQQIGPAIEVSAQISQSSNNTERTKLANARSMPSVNACFVTQIPTLICQSHALSAAATKRTNQCASSTSGHDKCGTSYKRVSGVREQQKPQLVSIKDAQCLDTVKSSLMQQPEAKQSSEPSSDRTKMDSEEDEHSGSNCVIDCVPLVAVDKETTTTTKTSAGRDEKPQTNEHHHLSGSVSLEMTNYHCQHHHHDIATSEATEPSSAGCEAASYPSPRQNNIDKSESAFEQQSEVAKERQKQLDRVDEAHNQSKECAKCKLLEAKVQLLQNDRSQLKEQLSELEEMENDSRLMAQKLAIEVEKLDEKLEICRSEMLKCNENESKLRFQTKRLQFELRQRHECIQILQNQLNEWRSRGTHHSKVSTNGSTTPVSIQRHRCEDRNATPKNKEADAVDERSRQHQESSSSGASTGTGGSDDESATSVEQPPVSGVHEAGQDCDENRDDEIESHTNDEPDINSLDNNENEMSSITAIASSCKPLEKRISTARILRGLQTQQQNSVTLSDQKTTTLYADTEQQLNQAASSNLHQLLVTEGRVATAKMVKITGSDESDRLSDELQTSREQQQMIQSQEQLLMKTNSSNSGDLCCSSGEEANSQGKQSHERQLECKRRAPLIASRRSPIELVLEGVAELERLAKLSQSPLSTSKSSSQQELTVGCSEETAKQFAEQEATGHDYLDSRRDFATEQQQSVGAAATTPQSSEGQQDKVAQSESPSDDKEQQLVCELQQYKQLAESGQAEVGELKLRLLQAQTLNDNLILELQTEQKRRTQAEQRHQNQQQVNRNCQRILSEPSPMIYLDGQQRPLMANNQSRPHSHPSNGVTFREAAYKSKQVEAEEGSTMIMMTQMIGNQQQDKQLASDRRRTASVIYLNGRQNDCQPKATNPTSIIRYIPNNNNNNNSNNISFTCHQCSQSPIDCTAENLPEIVEFLKFILNKLRVHHGRTFELANECQRLAMGALVSSYDHQLSLLHHQQVIMAGNEAAKRAAAMVQINGGEINGAAALCRAPSISMAADQPNESPASLPVYPPPRRRNRMAQSVAKEAEAERVDGLGGEKKSSSLLSNRDGFSGACSSANKKQQQLHTSALQVAKQTLFSLVVPIYYSKVSNVGRQQQMQAENNKKVENNKSKEQQQVLSTGVRSSSSLSSFKGGCNNEANNMIAGGRQTAESNRLLPIGSMTTQQIGSSSGRLVFVPVGPKDAPLVPLQSHDEHIKAANKEAQVERFFDGQASSQEFVSASSGRNVSVLQIDSSGQARGTFGQPQSQHQHLPRKVPSNTKPSDYRLMAAGHDAQQHATNLVTAQTTTIDASNANTVAGRQAQLGQRNQDGDTSKCWPRQATSSCAITVAPMFSNNLKLNSQSNRIATVQHPAPPSRMIYDGHNPSERDHHQDINIKRHMQQRTPLFNENNVRNSLSEDIERFRVHFNSQLLDLLTRQNWCESLITEKLRLLERRQQRIVSMRQRQQPQTDSTNSCMF